MKKSKGSSILATAIWFVYIFALWKKDGIKQSVSALFNVLPGNYFVKRIIAASVYVSAAFFLAYAVWLADIAWWVNSIGIIGAVGFARQELSRTAEIPKGFS